MVSNPYAVYKSTQVETASQERILLMLYTGLLNYMNTALDALREEQIQRAHTHLIKAQHVVTELMASLDMEKGKDVAKDLVEVYEYLLDQLIQANVGKDPDPLAAVIPFVEELREAWDRIITGEGVTRKQMLENSPEMGASVSSLPESLGSPRQDDTDASNGSVSMRG